MRFAAVRPAALLLAIGSCGLAALVLSATALAATALAAQERAGPTAAVTGRVAGDSAGTAVAGAQVVASGWGIRSSADGRFALAVTVNAYTVDQLEGIEVYRGPGETPPEYGGTSAMCGTVAIWTRVGR